MMSVALARVLPAEEAEKATARAGCRRRKPPHGDDLDGGAAIPCSQAFVALGRERHGISDTAATIRRADAATLQSQAQWLARYPAKRATVEGHADERGTREYNLALGERRANATKAYLVGLGGDAGRIQTVSYGKERPVAMGSDEGAWARNRRAVTMTVQ